MSGLFFDAPIIYAYTRSQALEDGVLVDVTETAREAGFRVPVAVTRAVWNLIDPTPQEQAQDGQDWKGRLWDVLWMASLRCRTQRSAGTSGTDTAYYKVAFRFRGRGRSLAGLRTMKLKIVSGPGDYGEHVITLMLPEED